jgi:hypothetical protein
MGMRRELSRLNMCLEHVPGTGSAGGVKPAAHVAQHETGSTCGVFSSKKMTGKKRCQSMLRNCSAKAGDMKRLSRVMFVEKHCTLKRMGHYNREVVRLTADSTIRGRGDVHLKR